MHRRQYVHAQPGKQPQQEKQLRCKSACRWPPRRRSANRLTPRASSNQADTKRRRECRAPLASGDVSREITPHSAAGLGNIFFRYVNVQIFPKSAQTTKRFLCTVLFFQEVHKVQHFLLFFRRQIAQSFEDLLFDGHRSLPRRSPSLYSCRKGSQAVWRSAANTAKSTQAVTYMSAANFALAAAYRLIL